MHRISPKITGKLYIAGYPTKSIGYGMLEEYKKKESLSLTILYDTNNGTLIAFLVIFIILFVGLLTGVIIYWCINRKKNSDDSQLEQEINV